jgi:hypothetical protein
MKGQCWTRDVLEATSKVNKLGSKLTDIESNLLIMREQVELLDEKSEMMCRQAKALYGKAGRNPFRDAMSTKVSDDHVGYHKDR